MLAIPIDNLFFIFAIILGWILYTFLGGLIKNKSLDKKNDKDESLDSIVTRNHVGEFYLLMNVEKLFLLLNDDSELNENVEKIYGLRKEYQEYEDWDLLSFLESYIEFNLNEERNSIIKVSASLKLISERETEVRPYYILYRLIQWVLNDEPIGQTPEFHTKEVDFKKINKKANSKARSLRKSVSQLVYDLIRFKDICHEYEDNIDETLLTQNSINIERDKEFIENFLKNNEFRIANLFEFERTILNPYLKKKLVQLNKLLTQIENSKPKSVFDLNLLNLEQKSEYSDKLNLNIIVENNSKYERDQVFLKFEDSLDFSVENLNNSIKPLGVISPSSRIEEVFTLTPYNIKKRYIVRIEVGYTSANGRLMSDHFDVVLKLNETPKYLSKRPYNPEPQNKRINYFFGRRDKMEQILKLINYSDSGNLILIFGLARMGKTSLLYEVFDNETIAFNTISVFFSLDELKDWSKNWDNTFIMTLIDRLYKEMRKYDMYIPEKFRELQSKNLEKEFISLLDSLEDELNNKDKRLIIVIDEFQRIEEYTTPKTQEKKRKIILLFKQIAVHVSRTSVIISGYHDLYTLMRRDKYWTQTLGKGYESIKISFLSEHDSLKLITQPMADFGISYEEGVDNLVYRYTKGYPWFIQLICDKLFEMKYEQKSENKVITSSDLDLVIDLLLFKRERDETFRHILSAKWADDIMESILQIISKTNENSFYEKESNLKFLPRDQVLSVFKKYGKNFELGNLLNKFEDLEKKDVLVSKEKDNKIYLAITLPLLHHWYEATGDVEAAISRI